MPFLIVLLLLALLAVIWFFLTYNRLVTMRVRVENSWSQIDVQLKRRHDLIPNLVETVKGYMQHERQTLENVIKARTQAIDAKGLKDKAEAENFLSQTLRSLFAVVERYPDLKANQNALKLQEELTSTENKIGFARQYYNDETGRYNTLIQMVPVNVVAGAAGFKPRDFFEVSDAAQREAPQVKF
ncbi:MAG: LemA family protein [Deltaproteobacteria bacterium]